MVDVHEGKVERTVTGPEGETPPFWNPIHGGVLTPSPDWTFDLVVAATARRSSASWQSCRRAC